jgi:hypothetical protein
LLADLLAKVAYEEAIEQRRGGPWRARPSSAGTERCERSEVYKSVGTKAQPIAGRTIILFDDGEWHEELSIAWIQKTIYEHHSSQMGVDTVVIPGAHKRYICFTCSPKHPDGTLIKGKEIWVDEDVVHGHIDGIITDPAGTDYLFEHKSASRFAFARWAKGDELPLDYFTQMALYIWGLRHLGNSLDGGVLLIKCKDTSAYMEYVVRGAVDSLDPEPGMVIESAIWMEGDHAEQVPLTTEQRQLPALITAAIARFKSIVAHRDAKTIPPRPFPRDHWRCSYCSFEGVCWEGWAEDVEKRKSDDAVELEPESTLAKLIVTAQVANAAVGVAKKKADKLKAEVKVGLNDAKIVSAAVNLDDARVTAKITMTSRPSWDEEKIPDAIIKKAKVVKKSPKLDLRRGKPKG